MKSLRDLRIFAMGLVVGLLLIGTTVYAASAIRSATFNDVSVIFNGTELELAMPLISVVTEENPGAISNYMPVRAVLEAMGYAVDWDGANNAVLVDRPTAITQVGQSDTEGFVALRSLFDSDVFRENGIEIIAGGNIPANHFAFGVLSAQGADIYLTFSFEDALQSPGVPITSVSRENSDISVTLFFSNGSTFWNEVELEEALRAVGLI